MRKAIFLNAFLIVFLLTTGIASANGVNFGFGFYFPFPPIMIGPPVLVAPPPAYHSPHEYYAPGYSNDYYNQRVWVPGHWETQGTDRGWERVYVLGHWDYLPVSSLDADPPAGH